MQPRIILIQKILYQTVFWGKLTFQQYNFVSTQYLLHPKLLICSFLPALHVLYDFTDLVDHHVALLLVNSLTHLLLEQLPIMYNAKYSKAVVYPCTNLPLCCLIYLLCTSTLHHSVSHLLQEQLHIFVLCLQHQVFQTLVANIGNK